MFRPLITFLVISLMLFACQQDTQRKSNFAVQGIDVSHYQAKIDWNIVAEQNFDFAFIKASEGALYTDSLFEKNWTAIQQAGMKRGAYHFFRPTINPYLQVSNFTTKVILEKGDLPPVLDIETTDLIAPDLLVNNLKIWLDEVESFYGIRPILYTNVNFYNRYLAGHFTDYPLWIARYNNKMPTLACGTAWQFWQYGNRGKIEGIDGYVDFNVFSGSEADLENLAYQPSTAKSASFSFICEN